MMELLEKEEQLTLFTEDSLVNLTVLPGTEKAKTMTERSGRKYTDLLKVSNPIGLLVRMCLESSHWGSTASFLTWKTSGTPRNRLLYRLVPSMHLTKEKEFSLWP